MSSSRSSHRAEFTLRCECGNEFHTSDSHIGKTLRCRCGRALPVARPADEYKAKFIPPNPNKKPEERSTRRRRTTQTSTDGSAVVIVKKRRFARWMRNLRDLPARAVDEVRHLPTTLLHGLQQTLRQPFDYRPVVRWTSRLSWGYLGLMIVTWLVLIFLSEKFLPATLLAYGPRFVVLVPLLVLVPAALLFARPTLVPLMLATWVGVHSIMGFRVSWQTLVQRHMPELPAPDEVRVLSYNVLVGGRLAFDLPIVINEFALDIIAFQECGDRLWTAVQALPKWHSFKMSGLCTASRWPIIAVDSMPREDLLRVSRHGAGGTGAVVRLTLSTPRGPLQMINLHLETVRKGLESVIGSEGFIPDKPSANSAVAAAPDARISQDPRIPRDVRAQDEDRNANGSRDAGKLELNSFIRTFESERASAWAAKDAHNVPLIIAGDFNLPVESTIFRRSWSRYIDAFEAAGTGFGWTKHEGLLLHARIDHILVNGVGLEPRRIGFATDYGSDHMPILADIRWTTGK